MMEKTTMPTRMLVFAPPGSPLELVAPVVGGLMAVGLGVGVDGLLVPAAGLSGLVPPVELVKGALAC